ncbi:MAG: dihydroorotase [Acidimicrobiia bacterium]
MILIANASILRAKGVESGSVLIDDGRVIEVGDVTATEATVIDAAGAWVGPGLVDLHAHFRDPGQTWKEDLVTGARAAAAGGYTAVVMMPNTDPVIDHGREVSHLMERASAIDTVTLRIAGALTRGGEGETMAAFDSMYEAGVRVFTDDGASVPDAALLRKAMTYLSDLPGAIVAEHAEDHDLARNGHLHEGMVSAFHGITGLPGVAEDLIVERDILLCEETGMRLHLQHLSTARSVEMARLAKARGLPVTAEATPHHLRMIDDDMAALDGNLKMYPPLRPESDREAVVHGLIDGTIDVVATDHAPHTEDEKAVPFEIAPRGVIGLETAASIVNEIVTGDQAIFFDRLSIAPAAIAGIPDQGRPVEPGIAANLVVFDPRTRWTPGRFQSKSNNSPFLGRELRGRVVATIHQGEITHQGDAS